MRDVASLTPYVGNARKHSADQVAKIAASIRRFGFNNPVLVDAAGTIVAGHGRVLAARSLGLAQVPVVELGHLTDAERRAYTIADNRIADESEWDDALLSRELAALAAGADRELLGLVGFDGKELGALLASLAEPPPPIAVAGDEPAATPAPRRPPGLRRSIDVPAPRLLRGDCRAVMATLPEASIDAMVTDPPYEIGFMGRLWDSGGVAFDVATWSAAFRVLKPGGHLVAFGAPRAYHRLAVAIEDAGFELRDCLMWIFGQGFPKSHDVSKGIDKAAGAERQVIPIGAPVKRMIPGADQNADGWIKDDGREYQPGMSEPATEAAADWQGWGTALKPAYEPIILARKPLAGTVAENVQAHGVGALNIDGCRVGTTKDVPASASKTPNNIYGKGMTSLTGGTNGSGFNPNVGRWPANVAHDGSDQVVAAFPETGPGAFPAARPADRGRNAYGAFSGQAELAARATDAGSAARFFYCAKASAEDRLGFTHPTIKPIALMQWLCRLVTPPGGLILDPFGGTGTTIEAAGREGFGAIAIELEDKHAEMIAARIAAAAPTAEAAE